MNTTSGPSRAQAPGASSACGCTVTSRPRMWNSSPRAATTSSKMTTRRTISSAELGRREHRLEQLIDLAHHALRGLVVDRGQGRLDLVEVLELREELDVRQLAPGGQELADQVELAEQVLEAGLRPDEAALL